MTSRRWSRSDSPVHPVLNRISGDGVSSEETDEIRSPQSGELFARVPLATKGDVNDAISAGVEAEREMAELTRRERAEILRGVADELGRRREELAETITRETGKPIRFSLSELDRAVSTFTLSAEEARRLGGEVLPLDITRASEGYSGFWGRVPVGLVAAITPFNFPVNLTAHKLGPAIAAGNPIILKVPMQAPVSALRLVEICLAAGVPETALSAFHCQPEVAERMVRDERVRLLSFTGSDRVGWHLKSIAGKKRVALELGGNAACIVHEDVDLDSVAERCAVGAFASAGQVCIKVQRLLVHRPVYDAFRDAFLTAAEGLPMGDPMDPDTVVGPMIDREAAERVDGWIQEAVNAGASAPLRPERDGVWIPPTVLEGVTREMKVQAEEVFGPVATLTPYDDFDEAIALANDTRFGLQAGVFTRDVDRIRQAYRELRVGGVIVNDYPTFRVDNFPYGGVRDSGMGREGVRFSIEEMTEIRTLVLRDG